MNTPKWVIVNVKILADEGQDMPTSRDVAHVVRELLEGHDMGGWTVTQVSPK